jgi:response regulator of citrate/malate metabolism
MIQGLVMKGVANFLIKKFKLDKIEKILDYVEKPNDADKVGKKNSKEIEKLKIEYKALRDIVIQGFKDGK